jgi:hypothetical protein
MLAAVLLPGQTSAQRGLAKSEDNLPFLFPAGMGKMRWTGTHLAGCDFPISKNPILWTVDRQGNRMSVAFDIPGAGYLQIRDMAAGPDGSLVAVGLAISDDSHMGTFIVWIPQDRSRQVITRVWPYSPQVVTVAPDGTIWTVGAMMNDTPRVVYPNVLRHYGPSGQLLASTMVRGVWKNLGGVYTVSDASILMASNDRIGWLTLAYQYVEFSFDAVQLGSYACPNGYKDVADITGIALSAADDLLVGGKWGASLAPLELDRANNTWKPAPVSQTSGKSEWLLGFDGLTLVTRAGGSLSRYTWSDAPPVGGQ